VMWISSVAAALGAADGAGRVVASSAQNEKAAEGYPWRPIMRALRSSTLAGLVTLLRLVDHIYAAFAAHDLAIAMTRLQRAERVCNLHGCLHLFAVRLRTS
jgi:hypothetical protein